MAASAEDDNSGGAAPTASDEAVAADGGTSGTNTQEAGVDEGDLVETDGRYVYTIVDGRTLTIVDTIEGTKIGALRLDPDQGMSQMILDGTRLALVVNGWGGGPVPLDSAGRPASDFGYGYGYGLTGVNVIDVADPTAPTSLGTSWFEGSAQAVRATDGVVRVVVTSGLGDRLPFVVPANGSLSGEERAEELNRQLVEESVAEDWLPRRIDEAPGGTTSTPITTIGCDRIGQPAEFSGLGLTWIATVDLRADAPETLGSAGVVSTGGTTYASAEHLYVSTVRWDPPVDGVQPMRPEPPTTAIHSFGIAGRGDAAYEASGVVDGNLLNQFSMSEHEGRLRVATTTSDSGFGGSSESQVRVLERSGTALEQVGVVSGLGVTEQIYSVRFLGNMAYVVTFRQMDPLYVVDLSDPTAPVVRGELKIPGYSAYLHPPGRDAFSGSARTPPTRAAGSVPRSRCSTFAIRPTHSGSPPPRSAATAPRSSGTTTPSCTGRRQGSSSCPSIPTGAQASRSRMPDRPTTACRPEQRASRAAPSSSRYKATHSRCRDGSPTRRATATSTRRRSSGPWSSPGVSSRCRRPACS